MFNNIRLGIVIAKAKKRRVSYKELLYLIGNGECYNVRYDFKKEREYICVEIKYDGLIFSSKTFELALFDKTLMEYATQMLEIKE